MNTNRSTFQLVIVFLGVTLLACVIGVIVLVLKDKAIPSILEILAGSALTAIGALLARTPSEGPQEVQVINQGNAPVPVEPA